MMGRPALNYLMGRSSGNFVGDGVVVLLLVCRAVVALPVIVGCFILNGAVVVFQPLLVCNRSLPVPTMEVMAVLMDAAAIKLLVALNPF
jgi:hypothetical protein